MKSSKKTCDPAGDEWSEKTWDLWCSFSDWVKLPHVAEIQEPRTCMKHVWKWYPRNLVDGCQRIALRLYAPYSSLLATHLIPLHWQTSFLGHLAWQHCILRTTCGVSKAMNHFWKDKDATTLFFFSSKNNSKWIRGCPNKVKKWTYVNLTSLLWRKTNSNSRPVQHICISRSD